MGLPSTPDIAEVSPYRAASRRAGRRTNMVAGVELLEEDQYLVDVVRVCILPRKFMLQYVRGVFYPGVVVEVYVREGRARRVGGESELDVARLVARFEAVGWGDRREAFGEVGVQHARRAPEPFGELAQRI